MEDLKPRPVNSTPLTPLGFLERAATVYGDCPSIIYNDKTYTWGDTHRRCRQLASSLSSTFGIKRGDVVSVVAPNIPAMYELHFGVPFTGAILNNINTRLDARTVSVILQHAESKLVFVDYQSRALVREAIALFKRTPPTLVLITDDDADVAGASSDTVGFHSDYETLVRNGDPDFHWIQPLTEWDPLVLNYTSGTTSSPKGVVHCHRGMFVVSVAMLIDWFVPKQPVYLWTLPMFHSNGWSLPWGMAAVGGTNICLRKFDAGTIYGLIKRHAVTHMCAAPVVLSMLLNSPDKEPLKHPVHLLTGGAPPPAPVLSRIESHGFIVKHGYGLTEVVGVVVSCAWKKKWDNLPAEERATLKARQGVRTIGLNQMDVVDPESKLSVKRDGKSLGEIVIKGGSTMLGYFKDPDSTRKCITDDGWYYTGDVGVIHPDGYLEIKDRSKDVIISGGENISSVEVESIIYSHPAVNEAAVVARPDEYWGETPCAFLSLRNDKSGCSKPTEKDIIEYCREKLPHYMVPKTVMFKEELPKTSTGKIKKFELREIAKAMGTLSRKSRL